MEKKELSELKKYYKEKSALTELDSILVVLRDRVDTIEN